MEQIGKYEVLDQIGSGGFATVFKGYDPFIKRPVAIKVCNSRDEESRQRFYREAEIVGSLVHRSITTVYDFGVHEDQPYLVEEYLSGEDLSHLVRRQEPKDLLPRLDFLMQIASGLDYAHQQGVIHRDIKPSNVRVLSDGRVKIMDFGTAKLAHVESHLTQAGMTLGTVAYLSPERLLGNPSGTNSDIFSYGVLAYELMSFRRPFSGRNIPHLIDQVLNAAPTPLQDCWPECPPKLAEVVHRCLFKDPKERYASCAEVLSDLEQIVVETTGNVPTGFFGESTPTATIQAATVQISGLIERARSLIARGRHTRAEVMLEEVLEMAPDNAEAKQLMTTCQAVAQPDAEPSATGAVMAWEGPEERRSRKRGEAVESIIRYIEKGELIAAIEALSFAEKLFGPIEDAPGLRRLAVTQAREQLATLKGEATQAGRRIVDQMILLRQRGQLDRPLAESLTARVLELDPEDLAAKDLLSIAAAEPAVAPQSPPPVPPPTAPPAGPGDERQRKLQEAVASIEGLLAQGDPRTAADALDFAIRLFGEFEDAPALRDRIGRALTTS